MVKSKSVIVTGSITIGIGFLIIVYFALISLGVIQTHKVDLVIETKSEMFTYDGSYHTYFHYELIEGVIADGHNLEVNFTGKQKNVGSSLNTVDVNIYDRDNKDITSKYNIIFNYGSLEVYARNITVSTGSAMWSYDGENHHDDRWELTLGSLVDGDYIEMLNTTNIKYPGEKVNIMSANIYNENGVDISNNYNVSYSYGSLEIKAIPLEFKSESNVFEYDGLEHNYNFANLIEGGVSQEHEIFLEFFDTSKIKNLGKVKNEFKVNIKHKITGEDVTEFYNISYIFGDLEVKKRDITFSSTLLNKTYDGINIMQNKNSIDKSKNLASGDDFTVIFLNNDIVDAGKYDNIFMVTIYDIEGNESNNYNITYDFGTIEVSKKEIIIKTDNVTSTYNGLFVDLGTIRGLDEIVSRDLEDFKFTLKNIKNAGRYVNSLTGEILNANGTKSNNYHVIYDFGIIEILKHEITVKTNSENKDYDGVALLPKAFGLEDVVDYGDNFTHQFKYDEFINAGIYQNTITVIIKDSNGNNSLNYNVTYDYGTIVINKYNLNITSNDLIKDYDGEFFSLNEFDYSYTIPTRDKDDIVINSTNRKDAGIYDHFFSVSFNNLKEINYNIIKVYGVLEINKIDIVITSKSATKVYDGFPLKNDDLEDPSELLPDHTLDTYNFSTITNPGTILNNFSFKILDNGENVTKNYNVIKDLGYLTITTSIYDTPNLLGANNINQISTFSMRRSSSYLFTLTSNTDGNIYLRDKSFGNYTRNNFTYGIPYNKGSVNALNFGAEALLENGFSKSNLTLEMNRAFIPYLKPYFINGGINNLDDVYAKGELKNSYNYEYIKYLYSDNKDYSILSNEELLYRAYVYNNYLEIDPNLKNKLENIARLNNLDLNNIKIHDIANLIMNYNTLSLEQLDFSLADLTKFDVMDYFFLGDQVANKQHFAAAGVLMYRALGIPARYTIGYKTKVVKNEMAYINDDDAHVWAEVYVNGFGWVPVDMTERDQIQLELTPVVMSKKSDGSPLTHNNKVNGFSELSDQGYTYEAVVYTDPNLLVGVGTSIIQSIIIKDPNGIDVTSEFDLILNDGKYRIYDKVVLVKTNNATKEFDGLPLTNTNIIVTSDYPLIEYEIISDSISSITNPGTIPNEIKILIKSSGIDVTAEYFIEYQYGSLTVTSRKVEITADDVTVDYTGNLIVVSENSYTYTNLAPGHSLSALVIGSGIERGIYETNITNVKITDEDGNDVTNYYAIDIIKGTLFIR